MGGGGVRKTLPQLVRMVSSNGKRPAPGVATTQRITPVSVGGGARASPVPNIMDNLGKIKSLNRQVISTPPLNKNVVNKPQPPVQPFRVSKPPQVPKSKPKIIPRNSLSNALPKPGTKVSPRSIHDDNELNEGESSVLTSQPKNPQEKHPSNKTNNTSNGGKAPSSQKLGTNRFNPLNSVANKNSVSGAPSRNGSSSVSGTKPEVDGVKQNPVVVAKKSAPVKLGAKPVNTYKKMKLYVPKMPGTNYDMPSLNAVGSYTNRNGEQVWVCLVCNVKEQDESSRDMICCDLCEDWYHFECVGIFAAMSEDDPWYCKRCIYHTAPNPTKDFPKLFRDNVPP